MFLNYEPNIKLLNKFGYSNKNGFIGGAITRIENNIIVFGDLSKIDSNNEIRKFIQKRNSSIIESVF